MHLLTSSEYRIDQFRAENVNFYKCDVTDPAAIHAIALKIRAEVRSFLLSFVTGTDGLERKIGEPTIIVNNAGIARGNSILDTTPAQFLLTYKVNVLGAHNILREFLPHCSFLPFVLSIAQTDDLCTVIKINRGHVQTTASCAAYMSIPSLSEYCCSKAAVLALHECLTAELVHRYNAPGVRTSVICPSKVTTAMGNSMKEGETQLCVTLDVSCLRTLC